MRVIICLLALCGMSAYGQTNQIIFPQLLSCSNTVLMTQAEFRCTSGTKVIFIKDGNYQAFEASSLSSNVLTTIGATLDGLEAAKLRKAQNDAAYLQARVQAQARDAAIKAQQIRQAQIEASAHIVSTMKPQGTISISHTYISGGDAFSGYEYTTATTTIPNK